MKELDNLAAAVSRFGSSLKAKLSGKGAKGAPEDQLRAPLETLINDLSVLFAFKPTDVVAIGESTLSALQSRPDYAVTVQNALVGFIEVKAPGKGADPRKLKDEHDRKQWEKLKSLPNLIYTDGNAFSLWRDGKPHGNIIKLEGDVESAGAKLSAPPGLQSLFSDFLRWKPIAPTSARGLAEISAKLCRLLRDEVTEQMDAASPALTALAEDWRHFLFPEASNAQFADGYAQAVTFGLLMARAQKIEIASGLDSVGKLLGKTNTLIGAAFRVLTDDVDSQDALKTSLGTLIRVLGVVDWAVIGKGDPDAWLYFYEHFLEVYDNTLRRQTGSYYTPPEVVTAMVRLVDEVLQDATRFAIPEGLASSAVTIADPAVGTGTYLLGVLRRIAATAEDDGGAGMVPGAIESALKRVIGFEMQFGPFAVAQLRLLAEVITLMDVKGALPASAKLRLYITNTLGNPEEDTEHIPLILRPLAESRREANKIKRQEPITVVIGNPPYKERAKGKGGWVESGSGERPGPLAHWIPPAAWGVSAHAKHLRNLYVYFWRWATWKVFGDAPSSPQTATDRKGVVCFITVAGFLNGPGFQAMRDYLRRTADEIWIIDCTPDGHQPEVRTRIFQGVQQPVCIVLAARTGHKSSEAPAAIRYVSLPVGDRTSKFNALAKLTLADGWTACPSEWRAPFLPESTGGWAAYPKLDSLFTYDGSGVLTGRTWVIAPDKETLEKRWNALTAETDIAKKQTLFHPHMKGKGLGDRHAARVVGEGLAGHKHRLIAVANDSDAVVQPVLYGHRSFDRQWIIPDNRLINRPNPTLWDFHSKDQIFATALMAHSPTSGPALTFTSLIPDHHHYKGSFAGRVFPLWADASAKNSNVRAGIISHLSKVYGTNVSAPDVMAYIATIASNPAYTSRFASDLVQPGLRIPFTADPALYAEALSTGREIIRLQTFGDRFPGSGKAAGVPRLPDDERPRIPKGGAIPTSELPAEIRYDPSNERLTIGAGFIDKVSPAVWNYEVSGKHVLTQWFSYRGQERERPVIGEKRAPSPLNALQPAGWLPEYTTELLNVLNVLGLLVKLEQKQADLLDRICAGPMINADDLKAAAPTEPAPKKKARSKNEKQGELLG